MRVFIKDYLLSWLFVIVFWVAVWIFVPGKEKNSRSQTSSRFSSSYSSLSSWLCTSLEGPLNATATREGTLKDFQKLSRKPTGGFTFQKRYSTSSGTPLSFGNFSTAVLLTKSPFWGVLNALAMFALIFSFFVLLISMIIWVVVFPLSLYRIFRGKEPHRGLVDFVVKYNLFLTGVLLAVRLIALHAGDISAPYEANRLWEKRPRCECPLRALRSELPLWAGRLLRA